MKGRSMELPSCMKANGGDPCQGYKDAVAELQRVIDRNVELTAENERLREALRK